MRKYFNPNFIFILLLLVVMTFANSDFSNPIGLFMEKLLYLPAIILGLSVHEFGHAAVATKLGDNTPKMQNRVTLNPIAHVDLFGFVCLMVAGFGWGKPVMINPQNFKNRRRDEFLVSIAGVTMNLIFAFIFALIVQLTVAFLVAGDILDKYQAVVKVFANVVQVNIVLMVFNLIPIPPLDGFSILTEILNLRKNLWYYKFYQNGFIVLMILLVIGLVDKVVFPLVQITYSNILWISAKILPINVIVKLFIGLF
ncbi:MAG: site-2 protease family protein [Eubacteriales bacterium]